MRIADGDKRGGCEDLTKALAQGVCEGNGEAGPVLPLNQ